MSDLFGTRAQHDAGGWSRLALTDGMQSAAVFGGPRNCYRYRLTRTWALGSSVLVVMMMTPSVAGVRIDDPTITKVTRMARHWCCGIFGTLMIGNCFAYRAVDQGTLAKAADPVGPDNDAHLLDMARHVDLVVMAHGTPKVKRLQGRGPAVVQMLLSDGIPLNVLRLGATGPWHPLYLPVSIQPKVWSPD